MPRIIGKITDSGKQSDENIQNQQNKLDALEIETNAARLLKLGTDKGGISQKEYKQMLKHAKNVRNGEFDRTEPGFSMEGFV